MDPQQQSPGCTSEAPEGITDMTGAATDNGESGQARAEKEAFDDLKKRVVWAVARTCPAWLSQQSEDLVQTVLTQLFLSIRKSEGEKQFSSIYLTKAAYGAVVDEIRRQCRRNERTTQEERQLEEVPADAADPERRASSQEISRAIGNCLARLIKARRLATTLYLQGCTVPETARRLNWSLKKAENLVYRGLANLRECLTAKGMTP